MTAKSEDWRGRTVLVTGCTGFLGSWISRRLCRCGATVIGLTRPSSRERASPVPAGVPGTFDMVTYGLTEPGPIQRMISDRSVDTVLHLAAQSKSDVAALEPPQTFEANIGGTWNLLEAVRLAGRPVRMVLASSDAVYGDSGDWPYTEASPTNGSSPYATSKICAEALARCYHRRFDLTIAIARTSNVYGAGDLGFQRIVPGTIRATLRGEAPLIHSDGRAEREYLHVEDAVDAYLDLAVALDRPEIRGATFNFTSEEPVSVSHIVDRIIGLMGRTDVQPRVLGRGTDTRSRIHSSCAKAAGELGWRARISLESGLKETIPWYRDHAQQVCEEFSQ